MDSIVVYLNSHNGEVNSNDSVSFNIQQHIEVPTGYVAKISLQDFSCLNSIYNIPDGFEFKYKIGSSGKEEVFSVSKGHYSSQDILGTVNIGFSKNSSNLKMLWDSRSLLYQIKHISGSSDEFHLYSNPILKLVNITHGKQIDYITSSKPSDILENSHNIHFSVREVNQNNERSTSNRTISNRICKIPVVNSFGGYIIYSRVGDSVRSKMSSRNISSFTISLHLDDGTLFLCDSFHATLLIDFELENKSVMESAILKCEYVECMATVPDVNKTVNFRGTNMVAPF